MRASYPLDFCIMRTLILGSSSPYRRELLARLRLPFDVDAPNIDETPFPGEHASQYVERLAHAKADEVGTRHPDALIISSDQCADLEGELLGKPGDYETAVGQLQRLSGQNATFLTGLCLLDTRNGSRHYDESRHTIRYRDLDDDLIEHYLKAEQPYNCTASFKSEGLGVMLTHQICGEDPTGLVGLPLIKLTAMLKKAGVEIA